MAAVSWPIHPPTCGEFSPTLWEIEGCDPSAVISSDFPVEPLSAESVYIFRRWSGASVPPGPLDSEGSRSTSSLKFRSKWKMTIDFHWNLCNSLWVGEYMSPSMRLLNSALWTRALDPMWRTKPSHLQVQVARHLRRSSQYRDLAVPRGGLLADGRGGKTGGGGSWGVVGARRSESGNRRRRDNAWSASFNSAHIG